MFGFNRRVRVFLSGLWRRLLSVILNCWRIMSWLPKFSASSSPKKQQDKCETAGSGFRRDAAPPFDRHGPAGAASGSSSRPRPRTPPRPAHRYSEPAWKSTENEARREWDSDDEFYCEYDSTWETDSSSPTRTTKRRTRRHRNYKFDAFEKAAMDMQKYRHSVFRQQMGYRGNYDKPNLDFYLGKKPSKPDGLYIHEYHNEWWGDYHRLEYVHTFIQWLFPLEEPGMNAQASMLTKAEIEDFVDNPVAKKNLLISYKLMLDFYGIMLCNDQTGQVSRAPNWRDRFDNLNCHTHNNLRITRIIKCLGILGYRHFQAPLVKFFLEETLVNKHLPNVKESVLNYFMFAVLEREQRRILISSAYGHYYPKDEFVWCPKKVQMRWQQSPARQVQKQRYEESTFDRMGFR